MPVVLVSAPNKREHWGEKAARAKRHRKCARIAWTAAGYAAPPPPYVVTLRRLYTAPAKKMDGDNYQASLKAIRDEVATCLGIDDGDARIDFVYEQVEVETGDNHVEVSVLSTAPLEG